MQAITATLLAMAQSLRGRPYVRCRIQDRILRWLNKAATATSALWSDSAHTNGYLVRIKMSAAGNLESLRTNAPTTAANWTTGWATIATGLASSCCALAVFGVGELRAFFLKTDGAGAYNLRCIESADSGATWINEHTVTGTLAGTEYLTAATDAVFVQDTQLTIFREPTWGLTGWATTSTWGGYTWTTPAGIGADYDATGARWLIAACGDGILQTLTYDGAYAGQRRWRPGAEQTPPAGSTPHSPDVAVASLLGEPVYIVTLVEAYNDGILITSQPTVYQSIDWIHFGCPVPLNLPATTHRRCALVYHSTIYLWAANEKAHCLAYVPLNWYTAWYLPTAFTRTERADSPGYLTIEITNPAAGLIAFDTWESAVTAPQPLAQIAVARGWMTSAGNEFLTAQPYYILSASYHDGQDGGRLRYRATDAWGLLALWSPPHPMTWQNRSIAWLLAEVVAQVGLDYEDDANAELTLVIPTFTLHPGQNLRSAVLSLLQLANSVGRFTPDTRSKLSVLALPLTAAVVNVGNLSETLWAQYTMQLAETPDAPPLPFDYPDPQPTPPPSPQPDPFLPNRHTIGGLSLTTATAAPTRAMRTGLELAAAMQEERAAGASEQDLLDNMLAHAESMAAISWRTDLVHVFMRPELQMWDRVELGSGCAAIGTDATRTLIALTEAWHGPRALYTSTLTLTADTV